MSKQSGARLQLLVLMGLAGLWRLFLSDRYYGWEEGDYGNLMMIQEVIDSRFTWFRTSHMPGWYALGAIARGLWPDPRLSALALTLGCSVLNVGVATWLCRRMIGPTAAWLCGLWLVFQPEMALFGASTLRSPVFVCAGFLGLALILEERRNWGLFFVGLSFLIRMEGFFLFFPPALLALFWEQQRPVRSLMAPLLWLVAVVIGWQAYITGVQGDSLFILGPLGINLAPDVHGREAFDLGAWLDQGTRTTWALLTWTLPRKVGWTLWTLGALGFAICLRTRRDGTGRWSLAAGLFFTLGFWLGEGFVAHHEPNHNLYWVWMLPAVPFLALLAASGWAWIDQRLRPLGGRMGVTARAMVFVAVLVSPFPSFFNETRYQLERSEQWYRPQLDLSRWMEDNLPPETGVLVSSIPEVWLKRQNPVLRVFSWWLLPDRARQGGREGFGAFLKKEGIRYVLWFEEDWTEAPTIAPFLGEGKDAEAGPVTLLSLDREDGYGWILYGVVPAGEKTTLRPPLFGSGERGVGWR